MKKVMALLMFLTTSLFAGQESGGTFGTLFIVQPSTRRAIKEALRDTKSKSFTGVAGVGNDLFMVNGSPGGIAIGSYIPNNGSSGTAAVILDIDF